MAEAAMRDFAQIIDYTIETFGARQAKIYRLALKSAMKALEAGPLLRGSAARDDVAPELRSLHVARQGNRGRHLIVYRAGPDHTIQVLRVLHDAMDLKQHISS